MWKLENWCLLGCDTASLGELSTAFLKEVLSSFWGSSAPGRIILGPPDSEHKGNMFPQNIGNRSPNNTVSHPTSLETSAAHSCAHLSSTFQCTPQQHTPVHTSAAHSCAHLSSTLQCTPQQHTPVHTSAAHSSAHLTAYILNVNLNHIGNGNLHQNILSDLVSVIFTDTVKMSMP